MAEQKSMTGLTDDEAKEFHAIFMQSMYAWFGLALIAHLLAWLYRPWL
ncbi:MAG: light-harvesting antenna LH1, beta subunit [Thermochromatium sp.]